MNNISLITVNHEALAIQLAQAAANDEIMNNPDVEWCIIDDFFFNGEYIYQDAQDVFNRWYDYYFNTIANFNVPTTNVSQEVIYIKMDYPDGKNFGIVSMREGFDEEARNKIGKELSQVENCTVLDIADFKVTDLLFNPDKINQTVELKIKYLLEDLNEERTEYFKFTQTWLF